MEKIENIKLEKDMKVGKLVEQMKKAGFGARKIGKASEIAKKMFKDDCRVFLGLAGQKQIHRCVSAAGDVFGEINMDLKSHVAG